MTSVRHPLDGSSRSSARSWQFEVTFLSLILGFYLLTPFPWIDRNVLLPLLEATATASSFLLNLADVNTSSDGVVVKGARFAIAVRRGCDPAEPIVLFASAVIASPVSLRRKLVGVLLGAGVLFALNLVRIISLYLVGLAQISWFETLHQEWWPGLFIVSALLMWLLWARWARSDRVTLRA